MLNRKQFGAWLKPEYQKVESKDQTQKQRLVQVIKGFTSHTKEFQQLGIYPEDESHQSLTGEWQGYTFLS